MNLESCDDWEPSAVPGESQQNIHLVLNGLLHCADIPNPMRPWEIGFRIANRILEEFFAQCDKERAVTSARGGACDEAVTDALFRKNAGASPRGGGL